MLRKVKTIKIPGKKEASIKGGILEFVNPDKVYLTTTNFVNTNFDLLVKKGDLVKIGQVVAKTDNGFSALIHSTVSGVVEDITKELHSNGKKVETIVVKNDKKDTLFEECTPCLNIEKLTANDIVSLMEKWSVIGRGGSGFPTYIKYKGGNEIDYVILNGVECEPFITADYVVLKKEIERVVRGLKYMMKAANAKVGIIAIKNNKKEIEDIIINEISKYDDIRLELMKDGYPNGWEKSIVKQITKLDYKFLPSEVKCIVNNVTTAYDVCIAVEENKPIINKYVTLAGSGMKKPMNAFVRVGTKASELLKDNLKDEVVLVSGGPMTGSAIKSDEFIITRRNNAIIAFTPRNENIMDKIKNDCMRCGKCSDHCPVNLVPAQIVGALKQKDNVMMKNLGALKCISCGICSYVCPSSLEVTDGVKLAKLFAGKVK